jgi:hypothetical protein
LVRWDRLFADLEGQVADLELEERDALVSELRDGEWAETSWRDLAGGHVVLEVTGHGRVEGEARLVNQTVVHLASDRVEHVVSASAVFEIVASERRAPTPTTVTSRLGWGHVLRAARDDGDGIRVTRTDGVSVDGMVDVVGRDFVTMTSATGRTRRVPFAAIAVLTLSAS